MLLAHPSPATLASSIGALLLACSLSASAQGLPEERPRRSTAAAGLDAEEDAGFLVAVNPAYIVLGGGALRTGYDFADGWSAYLNFQGLFDLPDFASEQFFRGGEGIDVYWDYAVGLEGFYRFARERRSTPYLKGGIGYEAWTITASGEAAPVGEDEFGNAFANLGVGYRWYPLERAGLFVGGSYDVIFLLNNTDDRRLGAGDAAVEYGLREVVPPSFAPWLELGWRF